MKKGTRKQITGYLKKTVFSSNFSRAKHGYRTAQTGSLK
jgi:hypothetical protein